MLEFMRTKSRSLLVYAVLGVIILTFVISFGPAANKMSCGGENIIATVDGRDVSLTEWQYSRALAGSLIRDRDGIMLVRFAMDKIIERKLLSNLARANGIRFTVKDAEDMILHNRVIVFGQEVPLTVFGAWPVDPKTQKPGDFNYTRFRNWVRHFLGIPDEKRFLALQVEEMEAKAYKDAFLFGLAGSSRSRWMNYQNEYLEITFKAARFAAEAFLDASSVTAEELNAFLATEEGKKAAEAAYAADEKKYAETPKKRHMFKTAVAVEAALLAEIRKQEKLDFESLKAALPMQVAALNGLARNIENAKALVKADAPLPETFVSLGHLGMTAEPETLDATMMATLWSEPLMTVQGPLFTDEGAVLYLAQSESGGKLTKEEGLRMAARDLLAGKKAQDAAQAAAEKALAALVAGKTPDQVPGMPEMLTEGPVNPLKGQPNLITRELATELWKLETPGKVLPRVIVEDVMGRKVFKIMFLENRKLPSREDFDAQEAADAVSTLSPRAAYALDLTLKDQCVKLVKSGKVQLSAQLQQALTFKRPADTKLEQAKDMPAEDYAPCQYVGSGMNQ